MKKKPESELEIYWNLKQLLFDRNIRRPQDFKDMLKEHGLEMSYAACHALFHEQPVRVTMKVILTICKMLNCSVSDLIVIRRAGTKQPEKPNPPKSDKVVPLSPHQKKLTGGRLTF